MCAGLLLLLLFALWTVLIQTVDVQPAGESGTALGFAGFNMCFHQLAGVHMWIYTATDWLGLLPLGVCLLFAVAGLGQAIKRKSLLKVDLDIILLGIYYVLVILCYLVFEMYPINYRPVLIEGRMEASYPSSTTLLVLSVMPTLVFQLKRRLKSNWFKKTLSFAAMAFSGIMVLGRLVSGVHWATDIVGAVLLSGGLFCLYKGSVWRCSK